MRGIPKKVEQLQAEVNLLAVKLAVADDAKRQYKEMTETLIEQRDSLRRGLANIDRELSETKRYLRVILTLVELASPPTLVETGLEKSNRESSIKELMRSISMR